MLFLLAIANNPAQATVVQADGTPDPAHPALKFWVKADAGAFTNLGSTLATSAGDRVQQWNNQIAAPGGSHAIQNTSGQRPEWIPGALNGLPIVRFDGSNDVMFATQSTAAEKTLFLVATLNSDTGDCCQGGLGTDSPGNNGLMPRSDFWEMDVGGDHLPFDTTRVDIGIPRVLMGIYDLGSTRLHVSGPTVTDSNAHSWGATGTTIELAQRDAGFGRNANIDFAEGLIYDGVLTVAEQEEVGKYLSAKWGIDAWEADGDGDGFHFLVDCDDNDGAVFPGNPEVCDGKDNDCVGGVPADELDLDSDGFATCNGDCDDSEPHAFPGNTAIAVDDDVDNDCLNGDECYEDIDQDGFGSVGFVDDIGGNLDCTDPGESPNPNDCDDTRAIRFPGNSEVCDGVDNDCAGGVPTEELDSDLDGFATCAGDCDDNEPHAFPGNTTIVVDDHIDNDCLNGDECYEDADQDGFGNTSFVDDIGGNLDCTDPGESPNPNDCDDTRHDNFPGNLEVCDGLDNDCDTAIDEGLNSTTYYVDGDMDGFGDLPQQACGSPPPGTVVPDGDCDDNDPNRYPGATELCNAVDDNCDTLVDEGLATNTYYADGDMDGFGDAEVEDCAGDPPAGAVRHDGDCNDADPQINPSVTEVCNGIDDDCALGIDDGLVFTDYYLDNDGDNYGTTALTSCEATAPTGYGDSNGDCNDTNNAIHPGAVEICNAIDDDCVGGVDDGLPITTYYEDNDGDTYGVGPLDSCQAHAPTGYGDFPGDCDDTVHTTFPDAVEICNGVDDDCDGTPDDNLLELTYYLDSDNDGFGGINALTTCATPPAGYLLVDGDCDDNDPTINPDEDELCDAIDQNCDGSATAGATDGVPFYLDHDDDGYGAVDVEIIACFAPPSYVDDNTDCNDALVDVNPAVPEHCSTVFDDDCDGEINEDDSVDALTYYTDADGDGSGTSVSTTACSRPAGFSAAEGPDCDDADPNNFPGGIEQCDGADNNCNTLIDDNVLDQTFYADNDADGFGDPLSSNEQCAPDVNFPLLNGDDCDDDSGLVNPDAAEVCDGIDNNCFAGEADASDAGVFYADADNDGYGDGAHPNIACTAGPMETDVPGDCDDLDHTINPAATEICDNVDNDCNGLIDVDSEQVVDWYLDADLDGFGSGLAVFACNAPGFNYSRATNDCDDSDGTVYPGALEVCDQVDNDCDLAIDIADPDYTGPLSTYFADTDEDTHGDPDAPIESCENAPPDGYVSSQDDCLDTDATVSPSANEIFCDGIDQDCSGDLESSNPGYADEDGDGYGDGAELCDDDADLVVDGGDCDDADTNVNPGAEEICNNQIDEDCQGGDDVCAVEGGGYMDTGCDCATASDPSWVGLGMLLLLAGSLRRRRTG